jgi:hypothetical protein
MSESGFHTEEDVPKVEPKKGWGELEMVFEVLDTECSYFARWRGTENYFSIEMKDLMYTSKFQEWCGKHYRFIPPDLTKSEFVAFRDAALERAEEREVPVGVKQCEQTAAVVMLVLKRQLEGLLYERKVAGQETEPGHAQ